MIAEMRFSWLMYQLEKDSNHEYQGSAFRYKAYNTEI